MSQMNEKLVWFITGAGRGMGVDITQAALAAGHTVVATGRNPRKVEEAVGAAADLLAVKLDITNAAEAETAVQTAIERFGRIDVLVNNAGNFYAGFFEEISRRTSEHRLRPTCSARSTSPARYFPSCVPSARGWS